MCVKTRKQGMGIMQVSSIVGGFVCSSGSNGSDQFVPSYE